MSDWREVVHNVWGYDGDCDAFLRKEIPSGVEYKGEVLSAVSLFSNGEAGLWSEENGLVGRIRFDRLEKEMVDVLEAEESDGEDGV